MTTTQQTTVPASSEVDEMVLVIGTDDMSASKRLYVGHGFEVTKSFGRKYTESPPVRDRGSWR